MRRTRQPLSATLADGLEGDDMGRARAGRPWYYLSFEERAALVGALGGITFGYDIGVISGATNMAPITTAPEF